MGSGFSGVKTNPEFKRNLDEKVLQEEAGETQIDLKIATFDYGICLSPFQFASAFSKSQRANQLSTLQQIFKEEFGQVLKQQWNDDFDWDIGNLDKHLQRGRYSPLYRKDAGVRDNKFLMNFEQFSTTWQRKFQKLLAHADYDIEYTQFKKHMINLENMDWIYYRTFVRYAFSLNGPLRTFEQILQTELAYEYENYMLKKFESKIINEGYKIKKLLQKLKSQKVDILFLQQINAKILQYISQQTKDYRIASSGYHEKPLSSAILFSWAAIDKICGQKEPIPLWAYNSLYMDPASEEMMPPPMLGKGPTIKDTKYYRQKFYSLHQEEESPLKKKVIETRVKGKKKMKMDVKPMAESQNPEKQQINLNLQKIQSSQSSQSEQDSIIEILETRVIPMMTVVYSPLRAHAFSNIKRIMDKIQKNYISMDLMNKLNWNNNTFIQFFHQFIFISGSLTSFYGEANNADEYRNVRSSLKELRKKYRKHIIVAGIDLDRTFEQIPGYYESPKVLNGKAKATVCQKRTLLQSHLKYSSKEYRAGEDYLISSIPIENQKIVDIMHRDVTHNPYRIPTEEHPYDHFIVTGVIKYRKIKTVQV